jgi:hypothetical protein
VTAAPAQQQASDAPAPDYRFARPQVTVEQAADTLFALAANEALYLRLTDE